MKRILFILLTLFPVVSTAQIIAGVASVGTHIVYPNDSLIGTQIGNYRDTLSIDIDCDSISDIDFVIKHGAPAIDGPHTLQLFMIDTNIQFCWIGSMPPGSPRAKWYNINDTLNCDMGYDWKNSNSPWNDEIISYGGMGSYPPARATDSFIAFRKRISPNNYQYGWFNVTFNFQVNLSPYIILKSYTAFCAPNSASNYINTNLFKLYPSLTTDNITVLSKEDEFKIEILNPIGQVVYRKYFDESGQHNISISYLPNGFYFARYKSKKGNQVIRIQKN